MKYSFLLAGTIKFLLLVKAPWHSMVMFLAVAEAPGVITKTVSAPSVMVWATYPEMACSSKVPRLVLVVVPHVPAWSPVPINSS